MKKKVDVAISKMIDDCVFYRCDFKNLYISSFLEFEYAQTYKKWIKTALKIHLHHRRQLENFLSTFFTSTHFHLIKRCLSRQQNHYNMHHHHHLYSRIHKQTNSSISSSSENPRLRGMKSNIMHPS